MNVLPRSLALRIVLALAVGAAGVATLQQVVTARERTAAARPAPKLLPPPTPSPLAGLGFRLVPVAGVVSLVARLSAVPPDLAPVVQVCADGSLAVRRPPVLAAAPADAPRGLAALVPNQPLADWSPLARAALVDVIAACIAARPVPIERVRLVDAPLTAADVASLLAWIP